MKYISLTQEYVKLNFHLRKVFGGNLNEAISLAEIDVTKKKWLLENLQNFYLNLTITTFQLGIDGVTDNHDKFFLLFGWQT